MKHLLSIFLIVIIAFQLVGLSTMIHPVTAQTQIENKLRIAAIKTGIGDPGKKILNAVSMTSRQTGLSETLILSLMYSESSFNSNAVSRKQYQGLMQIPQSKDPIHRDEDVNTLIGAKILINKLAITKGDMRTALILYKGWPINHPEGKRQADKVIVLARKLKDA